MSGKSALIDEICDMMSMCDLFDNLLPVELQTVASYLNTSKIAQRMVIFKEGDPGTFMCVINSGTVSVFKANADNKNVQIATLSKGRSFGEMAVLDGERRSAMCASATPCTLLVLSKDSLDKMLNENPKVAAKLIRAIAVSLSRRLRMADGKLVNTQDDV